MTMGERSQPERVWFWVAPLLVWFATAYSAPLIAHLYSVLFQQDALRDGQYVMIFPIGAAVGFVGGVLPAVLTVALSREKPNFAYAAFWVAFGYIASWTVVTIACEAIFAPDWIGGGVLMALVFSLTVMPMLLFMLLLLMTEPSELLYGLPLSLLSAVLLLVAFYFTPPRGWGSRREIEK
jgi:hypothetical protein